jgi:hypothetical protein
MSTLLITIAAMIAPAWFLGGQAAQTIYRARTDLVMVDVAVTDGRTPVGHLTKDDFELRDNGVVQNILDVSRERWPLDVTLTIDVSGSMTPSKRAVIERAVAKIAGALAPADRAAVATFASHSVERLPLQHPPLNIVLPGSGTGTALLDALLLSLVTAPVVDRRQLGLFMTDGDDTSSYFDAATVTDTARYATGQTSIVIVRDSGRLKNDTIRTAFRSVVTTTGGELIELEKDDDLGQAFLTALENFRASYVLRYAPTSVGSSVWHDVDVRVKSKKYTVRARRGYWSS